MTNLRAELEAAESTAALLRCGRTRYATVLETMRAIHERVAAGRCDQTWIVTEHEAVVTLGRNAKPQHMLVSREHLASLGVDVAEIERGGDATYHGPGQLVVYPLRKLARFREVRPLVSALESAIIAALASLGIQAFARPEHRGVYVGDSAIAAIGLSIKAMTSLHGFAINVSTALDYDRLILPCGTPQFGITSVSRELGRVVSLAEMWAALRPAIEHTFAIVFVEDEELAEDGEDSLAFRTKEPA